MKHKKNEMIQKSVRMKVYKVRDRGMVGIKIFCFVQKQASIMLQERVCDCEWRTEHMREGGSEP